MISSAHVLSVGDRLKMVRIHAASVMAGASVTTGRIVGVAEVIQFEPIWDWSDTHLVVDPMDEAGVAVAAIAVAIEVSGPLDAAVRYGSETFREGGTWARIRCPGSPHPRPVFLAVALAEVGALTAVDGACAGSLHWSLLSGQNR